MFNFDGSVSCPHFQHLQLHHCQVVLVNLMGLLKLSKLPWEVKCEFRLLLQLVKRLTLGSRSGKTNMNKISWRMGPLWMELILYPTLSLCINVRKVAIFNLSYMDIFYKVFLIIFTSLYQKLLSSKLIEFLTILKVAETNMLLEAFN